MNNPLTTPSFARTTVVFFLNRSKPMRAGGEWVFMEGLVNVKKKSALHQDPLRNLRPLLTLPHSHVFWVANV
jgi:hypothetical protein